MNAQPLSLAPGFKPTVAAETSSLTHLPVSGSGPIALLDALFRHEAKGVAMCVMWDPEAAELAHTAGIGKTINIRLGGKHNIPGDKPFCGNFRVDALSDGKFVTTGLGIPGRKINLGQTAVLTINEISIVTASKRMQAYDQDIFRHIGIEPKKKKILALKSTCHFRADFDSIAETTLVALAPGSHLVDPRVYSYKNLREGVKLLPLGPEHANS